MTEQANANETKNELELIQMVSVKAGEKKEDETIQELFFPTVDPEYHESLEEGWPKGQELFKLYSRNTITEYKGIVISYEMYSATTGLFAGFEGFIINEYVGHKIEDTQVSVQWAIFLLILSLGFNVMVCVWSVFAMGAIKWGLLKRFLLVTAYFCNYIMAISSCLFILSFCLFIWATPMIIEAKIAIYVILGIALIIFIILGIYLSCLFFSEKRREKVALSAMILA